MLISPEHLVQVFALLQPVSNDQTFGNTITLFNKNIGKGEHARIAQLFKFCIEDKIFTDRVQLALIYYLSYYIYVQNLPVITPNTAALILELLRDKTKSNIVLQLFIYALLADGNWLEVSHCIKNVHSILQKQ